MGPNVNLSIAFPSQIRIWAKTTFIIIACLHLLCHPRWLFASHGWNRCGPTNKNDIKVNLPIAPWPVRLGVDCGKTSLKIISTFWCWCLFLVRPEGIFPTKKKTEKTEKKKEKKNQQTNKILPSRTLIDTTENVCEDNIGGQWIEYLQQNIENV